MTRRRASNAGFAVAIALTAAFVAALLGGWVAEIVHYCTYADGHYLHPAGCRQAQHMHASLMWLLCLILLGVLAVLFAIDRKVQPDG